MGRGVEVLEEWAAALSACDAAAWAELSAEDTVHEDVAMGVVNNGPEELRAFAQAFFDAVPDFRVVIESSFDAGPSAVGQWEMSGTQTGDLPDMPASGRSFTVRGATVIALNESGEVARWTEYWDAAAWLRQLGFLPS